MNKLIATFLFLLAVLSAQTFRGGIQGTVVDSSGGAVAGVQITVASGETGLTRAAVTDAEGNYFFNELPLGAYKVSAAKAGFGVAAVTQVEVTVAGTHTIDFTLSPGAARETIEVTAEVPVVQTTGNAQGGSVESRQIANLPINGRDFSKAILLVPGAVADPGAVSDSPGSFGTVSVNGNRGRSNNYLLDGTDMNDGYRNDPAINEAGVFGTPATLLPFDAVAEVPVLSGADAEFGRNAGSIVNIVTKSGTNAAHGSAFEFFRNSALDARNYFNTTQVPKNPFHNNQFGTALGGPIVKDRAFYFFAYEGQRESGGLPSLTHVPSDAEVQAALTSATVRDAGGVNPVIANLLARHPWPAPNVTADANGNNLLATTFITNRLDSAIGKLDEHPRTGDVLSGRYYFGDSVQSFPLALVGGGNLPGFNTITPTRVQLVSISLTHIVTPRLLLEFRAGYNRFAEQFTPQDTPFDPRSIGLNTTYGSDTGMPLIYVGGQATLGANASVPRGRYDTNWQYFTNASSNRGRHNWKWGYEFRRTFVNGYFDNGYRGRLIFPDLASFLAGIPGGSLTSSNHQAIGDSRRGTFQNNHAFYAHDTIKPARNVTVEAGLRWDYMGVIGEERDRFSIFDPKIPGPRQVGQLYPKDYNNFAPRLSAAWDIGGKGKTVVRAGWGLFYDAFSQDFFVGQLPFNTFNAGPAYNDIGGANPVLFSGTAAINVTAGPCGGRNIPIPGTNRCAPPVFTKFSANDVFTVDQRIRTPYVHNFNVNVQRQFGAGVGAQVGYVGSAGRSLFRYRDINQADSRGAIPFPDFVYINQFESTAVSDYHSLQASLRVKRRRLTASVNYVWSHSIDTASDGQDFVPNATQPDNSYNAAAERANSNFDTRQRFSMNFLYQLPHGWAINGVVAVQTGQPVNLNYLFEGDFNGSGEYFGRPDVVGDPYAGRHLPDRFVNAAAFAVPCRWSAADEGCVAGTQHFGNLGRNALSGPPFQNVDVSLVKEMALGESVKARLGIDAYNLLNHPNFSNPLLPNFGLDFLGGSLPDGRGRGAGSLPILTTPDVGSGNPYLGGGGPRNLQVGVKVRF
jgi:hypothetical protein